MSQIPNSKIQAEISINHNLDEVIDKARQLCIFLEKARDLIGELSFGILNDDDEDD